MLFGTDTFGTLAWLEVPGAGTPSGLVLAWDAQFGRTFLYELTVYRRNLMGSWIETFGTLPFATVPNDIVTPAEATLRYSDTGYISKPTDSVPNTSFEGSVSAGLQITRTTPAVPEASRRVTVQVGTFSLTNDDGSLDGEVQNDTVDGRKCRVLLGLNTNGYDQFVPIYTGRMVEWDNDGTNVNVNVRDESYRLDIPLQTDLYDGTGGYNGDSNLAGKPRPLGFGKHLNISPPLINGASLIYQVSSRSILAVDSVYDRGATITTGADYANYAALAAATVAGGTYATCVAFGLFRLGSAPSGLVTCDVRGDAVGGYVDTTALIAKRIIKDFGGLADTDLNLATWNSFDTNLPGTIGWWQGTASALVSDALNAILAHCAGWWGANPNGKFEVGRISPPTSDSYVQALAEKDMIKLEILPPLSGTDPPRFRQRVGYQKNWTPQQDTDLAAVVGASRRQFLAQDYRLTSSTDLSVQASFLLATDPDPLGSLFDNQSDAQSLGDGLLTIYKAKRQPVRVTLDLKGLSSVLSATTLITHRRLNGGSALPMLLMDSVILADARQMQLLLWG
jgi:hypothetical protein